MAIRQGDFEKTLDLNAQAIEIIKSTPDGDRQLEPLLQNRKWILEAKQRGPKRDGKWHESSRFRRDRTSIH
jgi:hypothetical protein